MTLLVIGILLFAGVHLIPSLAAGVKLGALKKMGEGGYKGLFSLLLLGALALMVAGWRSADPETIYSPSAMLHRFAIFVLVLAFWLMTASAIRSRIRAVVRHPQLTGIALWGIGHLLLNGDTRAVVLFGGLTVWSVVEIFAISRRDGVWIKGSSPAGWGAELAVLFLTALAVGIAVYIHPWLSGVPVWW